MVVRRNRAIEKGIRVLANFKLTIIIFLIKSEHEKQKNQISYR